MERYETSNLYHAWYEHWHRYHWIAPWLKNKCVADMACGEGYGSALLAQQAQSVVGVDLDRNTIRKAQKKYQKTDNLSYQNHDILDSKLASDSMDVVVSFETLEHLYDQQKLLSEFKRVLKDDGLVVISTPDKAVYSGSEHHNEYHVKELYQQEFKSLVEGNFQHVLYFGQQLQAASFLSPLNNLSEHGNEAVSLFLEQGNELNSTNKKSKPTYIIALASDSVDTINALEKLGSSHMNDVENSLFNHYEAQVKRLLEADQRLEEFEKQTALQSQLIIQLQARLGL